MEENNKEGDSKEENSKEEKKGGIKEHAARARECGRGEN